MSARIDVDEVMIANALAGDADTIAELIRRLQGPFFGLARRMMLDPADAEDATQEALLRVITRLAQYRAEAKFSSWAFRIAANAFFDFRGLRYRQPMLSLDRFHADLADGLEHEAPERADDAVLLEQLKLGCGVALLGTLDADHRVAYILGEILELSGEEATWILEIPPATFRKRLSRARDRVREALDQNCGIANPANDCRCHRRLTRAKELGRVAEGQAGGARLSLRVLREQISRIDALERAVTFYRADPAPIPQRDFVTVVRELLNPPLLS